MSKTARKITRDDILGDAAYERVRREKRDAMIELKRRRRMSVGPFATFYFENFDTMWYQVHEMLRAESGGEAQVDDELAAYNPLIPNGRELVATLMFEIEDPAERHEMLSGLGGVEETVTLTLGADVIKARPEHDVERTKADGKTSSVHFLHFPLTDDQAVAFKAGRVDAVIAINRRGYQHMATIPAEMRTALAADLD